MFIGYYNYYYFIIIYKLYLYKVSRQWYNISCNDNIWKKYSYYCNKLDNIVNFNIMIIIYLGLSRCLCFHTNWIHVTIRKEYLNNFKLEDYNTLIDIINILQNILPLHYFDINGNLI